MEAVYNDVKYLIATATATHLALKEKHRAFDQIVRQYQDLAYGYAYAVLGEFELAEDAAQEAFLTAWRSPDQLREPEAFPVEEEIGVRMGDHLVIAALVLRPVQAERAGGSLRPPCPTPPHGVRRRIT